MVNQKGDSKMKNTKRGTLSRKPKLAVRVTVDGKRVWQMKDGKIYNSKKEYFAENEKE